MAVDVDETLVALADPTRRAIVDLLHEGPHCASELADALSTSRPAMSRHLRVLRTAGVVSQEILASDTRVRVVRLRREPFQALRGWLDEVEAFWTAQLGGFKTHVEKQHGQGAP